MRVQFTEMITNTSTDLTAHQAKSILFTTGSIVTLNNRDHWRRGRSKSGNNAISNPFAIDCWYSSILVRNGYRDDDDDATHWPAMKNRSYAYSRLTRYFSHGSVAQASRFLLLDPHRFIKQHLTLSLHTENAVESGMILLQLLCVVVYFLYFPDHPLPTSWLVFQTVKNWLPTTLSRVFFFTVSLWAQNLPFQKILSSSSSPFISGTWPIEKKNSIQTETHSESTKNLTTMANI